MSPVDRERWLEGARHVTDATGSFFSKQPRRAIPSSWGVYSTGEIYGFNGAWLVWHPEGALKYSSTTFLF